MEEIRVIGAGREQADWVRPFLNAEMADALDKGLPVTVLAAAYRDRIAGTDDRHPG